MKNRILAVVALSAMVGVAACERQEEGQIQTPATEAPATAPAPTMEPAPVMTDTMMMHQDTLHQDGMGHTTMPGDTL